MASEAKKKVLSPDHGGELIPIQSHEQAVEMGRKGGTANTINQYLARKKKCVTKGKKKCRLFDRCMLVTLSSRSGRCEVNLMEPARRNRIIRLLQGDPEAIKDELMIQTGKLLAIVDDNPSVKGRAEVVKQLMGMYKTVFDKGHTEQAGGNTYIFNWQLGPDTGTKEKVVEAEIEEEDGN
jgi:hypothetical protein